ncbi:DNA repair protein [Spizellomyces punctatus DAOM BR117]|uniref:DNA repair protein n=1 Tax=Spizellomyces punctatus (strain DAOM BR117) TaxID=645134 RepID=A0A0L0HPC3_SPIPD|nr:DNA repair protein [Spizellomyces punctatus DAOM BR117]KND02942.1 DNA repair protein [Spizellomyces punctatus DAOM BR117]|eukprot:XP_016610981.1 DNA repair protein [Spizellomyces punctatus DAOM BR117]
MPEETTRSVDEIARIANNRAVAKARLEQRNITKAVEPNVTGSVPVNAEAKPTAVQRKRRAIDLNYCEYNFATMKDTKGGFILEEQGMPDSKKQKHEEKTVVYEPPIDLVMENNPRCEACQSIDVDPHFQKHFRIEVCRSCKDKHSEKYSLLTKTECREDYLLTESELRDSSRLPHWERPNPHKSTYSNMLLYLRFQVEKFAWEKWGSPEALDREFESREREKKERKEKKFKSKLSELRKKTRTSTWQRRADETHVHKFGEPQLLEGTGEYKQTCACGISNIYETL